MALFKRDFVLKLVRIGHFVALAACLLLLSPVGLKAAEKPRLVYLVSDLRIPFWSILAKGVRAEALERGYEVSVLSAKNQARQELTNLASALKQEAEGLIISPTNSSACVTLLDLAEKAGVPVVIADIGTEAGEYVSYISSDNRQGAYQIGKVLVSALKRRGWQKGKVGIVAIPQTRANGRMRTEGFLRALEEGGIGSADLSQQVNFSHAETLAQVGHMLELHRDLRAVWLQGSDRYQAALEAIKQAGREGEVLLVTFDAEPEFLELIPQGVLVGAAMQQPYLMGEVAVKSLDRHLNGESVPKKQQLPILAVSKDNIAEQRSAIIRNVLGRTP